ncbi:MAG: WbqC family protein [Armatimonadota bacterium]|nr:WbqC family protein [Armatimonadota bacterium]MDR7513172.1 WbqC family protein [Armatimonadota bacterium]
MIVAAHQPHYLPWLRYMAKAALADVFVLLDDAQYTKNGWQNRNRIKTADGWTYLTVPVHAHADSRILEVEVAGERWRTQHWKSLRTAYGRAPYFSSHAGFFESFYATPWERLVDLNLASLEYLRSALGIRTPFVRASSLGVAGGGSERLVRICKELGATVYLSGAYAAGHHLDPLAFGGSGVALAVVEWECPTYRQCHPKAGFVPDLSVVDLLFNEGPRALAVLLGGARILQDASVGGVA